MYSRTLFFPLFVASLISGGAASGQALPSQIQSIDEAVMVSLPGNVHPLAAMTAGSSAADMDTPMHHMVLSLKATDAQEAQLEQLIADQSNPKSPRYHQYLTPQAFGAQFGASQANISVIKSWLQSHGFNVEEVTANNRAIVFSGTAGQVADAFKTEIRQYTVAGTSHFANASDPKIPAALSGSVGGIVKLHDFGHASHISKQASVSHAEFTAASGHYLAPADYSTIYDISPLYKAGINGTGQTIAILAKSNINLSDVQTFRSDFGLKANQPQIIITGTNPGVVSGDSTETTLDTEWSGAVAPNATIKVIVAASTNTADGIDLAATYAVNNNVAPVLSLSYGSCEQDMGSVELSYYNGLWKEAASQGMSVMVSSGDSGAAGCSSASPSASSQAVNGLCSSTYATCVGGTEFAEGSNPGQYWLAGNNPTYGSAISYIPEKVWNESASNGGSGSYAGGGGQSINFVKPAYQATPGVSVDDRRDVPDVALTAAGHDGYLIILNGSLNAVGGTSAAAPAFAGMMALVDQKTNSKQGLANYTLYPLASLQATAGGAAIFHDITLGNNSVPGVAGFAATTGFDKASGLGSVDAANMVNHWLDASASTMSLSASSGVLTINLGQSGSTTLTTLVTGSLTSPAMLSLSKLPKGVTGGFTSPTIPSATSGSDPLSLNVSSDATPGTYPLTVTATAGTLSANATVSLVIPQPNFTLVADSSQSVLYDGNTSKVEVVVTPTNGLNSTVALSVAGLPTGVTAVFSKPTTSGTTGGLSALTFTASLTAAPGTYPLSIMGTSGGITKSTALTLYVYGPQANCTMASNPSSITLNAGSTLGVQLSCKTVQGSFTGPLNLTITGAPSGVTIQPSSGTLNPGSTVTMNLSAAANSATSTSKISVTASSGSYSQTLTIPLTVLPLKK